MTVRVDALTPSGPPVAMPHRWRFAIRVLAPIAILAIVVGTIAYYRNAHTVAPVRYETVRVDRGPIVAKVTSTGTVSPLVTVLVGSQVSGRIDKIFADFGSRVSKGEVIATIEPAFFRAAVTQARANQASAKAAVDKSEALQVQTQRAYGRTSALFAQGLATRTAFEAAEADLAVANAQRASAEAAVSQTRAALEQATLNFRYTTIVSPIDGVVLSRNVDVGQTVAATLQAPTLFTIARDLAHMQVDTNIAEADVGKVRAGMPAAFTVDAYPGHSFEGVVRQVRENAQTVQNVVTYDAVIDVDNSARLLKPGMTASVALTYATRESALRVANGALRFKPDAATLGLMNGRTGNAVGAPDSMTAEERLVWVLRNGTATAAVLRLGVTDGSTTEVTGGDVREGDGAIVEAVSTAAGR